jgi:hypothetical protein
LSASYQFVHRAANGAISRSSHSCPVQQRCRESPLCEFGFLAACARSVENAASAQSSVLPRGGKTSHSWRVQQGSEVEFTHCGLCCRSLKSVQRLQLVRQLFIWSVPVQHSWLRFRTCQQFQSEECARVCLLKFHPASISMTSQDHEASPNPQTCGW